MSIFFLVNAFINGYTNTITEESHLLIESDNNKYIFVDTFKDYYIGAEVTEVEGESSYKLTSKFKLINYDSKYEAENIITGRLKTPY